MTEQEFTDKYCCTDSHAEYCNDDCDSCERKFKKDLEVIKERIRADVIDEIEQKLKSTGCKITFDLPVEEILGEDIDLDDFAMLVQDAVQVYRKMVLGVLEQLKEQKNDI